MITEDLQNLYQKYTGVPAESITELPPPAPTAAISD